MAETKVKEINFEEEIFRDDYIGRKEFCDNLVNLIKSTNAERAWSIGLNGSWGSGKSVVLNYLEKMLENEDVFFIKYNAWENDFYKDPLIAMISSIVDYIEDNRTLGQKFGKLLDNANEVLKKSIFDLCKVAGGKILDAALDLTPVTKALKDTVKTVKGKTAEVKQEKEKKLTKTEDYKSYKDLIKEVQVAIREIVQHKKLVFVVDELDRCLPEYAIEVLERLHHIFGLEKKETKNLIVLLAVDKEQLDETIKQIYGARVNKDKYLEKFIDLQIDLPSDSDHLLELKSFYYLLEKKYNIINYSDNISRKFFERSIKTFLKGYTNRQKIKLLKSLEFIFNNVERQVLNIYNILGVLFLLSLKNQSKKLYDKLINNCKGNFKLNLLTLYGWIAEDGKSNSYFKALTKYIHIYEESYEFDDNSTAIITDNEHYYMMLVSIYNIINIEKDKPKKEYLNLVVSNGVASELIFNLEESIKGLKNIIKLFI